MSEAEAQQYIKKMEAQKRYSADVWSSWLRALCICWTCCMTCRMTEEKPLKPEQFEEKKQKKKKAANNSNSVASDSTAEQPPNQIRVLTILPEETKEIMSMLFNQLPEHSENLDSEISISELKKTNERNKMCHLQHDPEKPEEL